MVRSRLNRRQLLALAALGVAAPAAASRAGLRPASAAPATDRPITVPMLLIKGKIFVEVTLNGRPVQAVIDSGGWRSGIDAVFAEEAGIRASGGTIRMATIQGPMTARQTDRAVELSIGGRATAFPMLVTDFGPLTSSVLHPVRALLGVDFLRGFIVELDFEAKTVTLHPRQGFAPPAAATLLPLARSRGGYPGGGPEALLAPLHVEGRPLTALVDTGSSAPLIVSPRLARQLDLVSGRRVSTAPMGGVGGAITGLVTSARSLEFGSARFDSVPILVAENEFRGRANLGLGVLERFHVWLDLSGHRLWLVRNGDVSPMKRDRAGFYGMQDGDTDLRVTFVARGGPGEAAGLKAGDVIKTINGMPAMQGQLALADAPDGQVLRMTLESGAVRSLTLGRYY